MNQYTNQFIKCTGDEWDELTEMTREITPDGQLMGDKQTIERIRSEQQKSIDFYLEWFNDFLTIDRFASYHGITPQEALRLVEKGKRLYKLATSK